MYSKADKCSANKTAKCLTTLHLGAVFRTASQCIEDEYVRNVSEQMEKIAVSERKRVSAHKYKVLTVTHDFFKPKLATLDELILRLIGGEMQVKSLANVRIDILEAIDALKTSVAERN